MPNNESTYFVIRECPEYMINGKGHVRHAKSGYALLTYSEGRGKAKQTFVNLRIQGQVVKTNLKDLLHNIPPF